MRCIFFLHFINSNLIKDVLKKILELRQKLKKKLVKKCIRTHIPTNLILILLAKKKIIFWSVSFPENEMNLDIFALHSDKILMTVKSCTEHCFHRTLKCRKKCYKGLSLSKVSLRKICENAGFR